MPMMANGKPTRSVTLNAAASVRNALTLVRGRPTDQLPRHGVELAGVVLLLGGGDPGEFVDRYREELAVPAARLALGRLRTLASSRRVTLVYAASNRAYNNAVALSTILDGRAAPRRKGKPCST